MGNAVVEVEGIGKRYRRVAVRNAVYQYDSLREWLTTAVRSRLTRDGRSQSSDDSTFWALRDVSFTVAAGEVIGIIGSNGAGKSTLLKILSRITRPTTGRARLHGRVGSLLEVGTGFHPELSGRDNVFLNGAILGMPRREIQRRFDNIVDFSGISSFIDTPVKRYSSGMYVRLAFAVAAHLEPDILIVDEVLAVGDADFQRRCLGKLESVVRGGRTVLFVSHNMAAIKTLCHRALLIKNGEVAADGDVDSVVQRYLSGGQNATASGDIPDDVPRSGTGEARVRRVELRDAAGMRVEHLYLGDPLSIHLTVEVLRPVRDVTFAVMICAPDGTPITASYSTDHASPPWTLAAGWHEIALALEMTLLPRPYTVDVYVATADGRDIDLVHRVAEFTSLRVARSGSDGYRWNTVVGFVRPAGSWKVRSMAAVQK